VKRLARALVLATPALTACAGGAPLLHSARALDPGDVAAAAGFSANVATGSLGTSLANARTEAAANTNAGVSGVDPTYAKGALVAAAVAPGLAPFVAARVGLGAGAEAGITYTGRGARIDMRETWTRRSISYSVGAGGTGYLYDHDADSPLPNVDLGELHGWGFDVPLLVSWRASGGLYEAWGGVRGGYDSVSISELTSIPNAGDFGNAPYALSGTRVWGGGLVGVAMGFRHVHVALELDAAYQHVSGSFNGTNASVDGVALTPGSALWVTF
jgi:hypothetical protein